MKPTPQLSCSFAGSYRPSRAGGACQQSVDISFTCPSPVYRVRGHLMPFPARPRLSSAPNPKVGKYSHSSEIVALRQPKWPFRYDSPQPVPKRLASARNLRFNLNKVAYMLVAALKTGDGHTKF